MYNRIAGQSLDRIAALSDGVFAIAMTLIVLDIRVPPTSGIHSEADLCRALSAVWPELLTYGMSFLTLGIFWTGQQTQLNHLERANRDLGWLHIGFLSVMALLPFSTHLLADFITYRTALLIYWANILVAGVVVYACWAYAVRAGLVKEEAKGGMSHAMKRRIVIAQGLYAFGAALCVFDTSWSIGFIVAVQLNYAIAPRIRRLYETI